MSNNVRNRKTVVSRINIDLWKGFTALVHEGSYDRAAATEEAIRDWMIKKGKEVPQLIKKLKLDETEYFKIAQRILPVKGRA